MNVRVGDSPEPIVAGQLVSGNYYGVLGISAVEGRTLTPDDDRLPGGHPVAMISYGYWKRRFALDPSVFGRTIRIAAMAFTVVGVTPPEFFGLEVGRSPDITVPLMMQPVVMPDTTSWLTGQGLGMTLRWVRIAGRLRAGVSEQSALAGMTVIYESIRADNARVFSQNGISSRAKQLARAQADSHFRKQRTLRPAPAVF